MAEPIYEKSVFAKYFASDDAEAVAWADNVLAKLVAKGIVPNYIERDGEGIDTDFEVIYKPVTLFFAYLVRLAREFRDFKDNATLGDQYLLNKSVFMCGDETLNQILYLIRNLLRVRAERGTVKMFEKSSDLNVPDGEMLRMLCWDSTLFFKLGVAQSKMNSWNVGNSSPLFRGCTGRYDLNVGYEYTESIKDLLKYPLINENYVYLSTYQSKECLEIRNVPAATVSGIGDNVSDKRIVVTPELNFEITFYVAQDTTLENITFGCLAFNASGNSVPLQNIVTGGDSNFFFETRRLNQPGKFYMVRGILYNKDADLLSSTNGKLNIGFGHNLRMTEDVVSIIPYIVFDNVPGDDVDAEVDNFPGGAENEVGYDSVPSMFIWNLKVTPCSLFYERSYLNNKNFIDILAVNKNGRYTDQQVIEIFRDKFIPYNTSFNVTFFDSIIAVLNDLFLIRENGDYLLLENDGKIPLE